MVGVWRSIHASCDVTQNDNYDKLMSLLLLLLVFVWFFLLLLLLLLLMMLLLCMCAFTSICKTDRASASSGCCVWLLVEHPLGRSVQLKWHIWSSRLMAGTRTNCYYMLFIILILHHKCSCCVSLPHASVDTLGHQIPTHAVHNLELCCVMLVHIRNGSCVDKVWCLLNWIKTQTVLFAGLGEENNARQR